ncbi:MAG: phosphate ABC transporter permease PstA [Cyanobacteria bacterium P01_A01_bin.80]
MNGYPQSNSDESIAAELLTPLSRERQFFSYGMNTIAFVLSILALLPLLSVSWEILVRGISNLSLDIFTTPFIDGGFANAIVGTITMVAIACVFSIPCGVITGIFLAEFGQESKAGRFVRFVVTILTGVPSIVVGVFAYGTIVLATTYWTKGAASFSAVAGGFALGVIMLPIIALTTEEVLKLIPSSLRSASAALGGTRFQTISKVLLPAGISGITTGILLAVSRAAGETAPLIFTALFSFYWSEGIFKETASLSVLIFNFFTDDDPKIVELVWTASIVLVGLVLFFNLLSRIITRRK